MSVIPASSRDLLASLPHTLKKVGPAQGRDDGVLVVSLEEHPPVVLAAIAGAHGVAGEVRLKLFAQGVDSVARHRVFDVGGRVLTLLKVRDAATGPVARFAEVTTREAAEVLRGTTLAVPRAALPPPADGEVYVADLIGLPATADGAAIGQVIGHENFGAGDLIEVEAADKRRFLVPFARCELAAGALAVDPAFIA